MAGELPVVFLAFANAPESHLQLLKAESRAAYEALQPLQAAGRIAVHREESTAFSELYDDLLTYTDRLVIFHYGGHADGERLALEGGAGSATGLARLLGQQSSLRLVFLNGCATQGHVAHLLDAGVPAVIATSVPIGDRKAQEFSTAFYAALAEGRSISQAFDSGRGFVEGAHGTGGDAPGFTRQIVPSEDEDSPVLEWGLFTREDRAEDLDRWRLPDAQADWRVQLVDARGPLRDLDGEPTVIEHRLPVRTVPAALCRICGTTSTLPAGDGASCPVCGSVDLDRGPSRTMIAGLVVPSGVTADQARARVLGCVRGDRARAGEGGHEPEPLVQLRHVFIPCWIFDVDTRTTFEAERAWNRTLGQVVPTFEWEPVKDAIDLGVEAYLVQAGSAPVGRSSATGEWYWELDRAEPLDPRGSAEPAVPFDTPVQAAFDQVAAHLGREVEAAVEARVGGHQQRNLTTDTRYRRVSARTVLLPHWYATVGAATDRVDLVLNGQTGAIRRLVLPVGVGVPPCDGAHRDDGGVVAESRSGGVETDMTKRTYEPGDAPSGTGDAISVFSGAGIGLMVGVLLGLSVSPVVGIFVGALGTGLAGLLGFNDRHFSRAKGIRIGTFGLAAVVGVAGGVSIRTHDLFSRSLLETRDEYIALGFTPREALDLLKDLRLAPPGGRAVSSGGDTAGGGEARLMAGGVSTAASVLFSSPVELSTCASLKTAYDAELPSTDVIGNFRLEGKGWAELANATATSLEGDDQKALLFIARDAACAATPPRLAHARCQRLGGTLSPAELEAEFAAADQLRPVRDRVTAEITPGGRIEALRLLGGVFCPGPS